MLNSSLVSFLLCVIFALIHVSHNLDYSDLEALGVDCPEKDMCAGYRFDKHYTSRSCECDSMCTFYGDCCIDYHGRSRTAGNGMTCLNIGVSQHTGVYAIANCSTKWSGLPQIRENCEGSVNLGDPLFAAPVISVAQGVTYKNRDCAQCNNAILASLKVFEIKLACYGLFDLSNEEILADITYNQETQSWGVKKLNARNETTFYSCDIIFDAPPYLDRNIRFCRANVISTCSPSWTRKTVRENCAKYTAVVYDHMDQAYRNPHCALCNYKSLNEVSCVSDIVNRKGNPFYLYIDINSSDDDRDEASQITTSECQPNYAYDPFFKTCRRFACDNPGDMLVDDECISI